jgi:pyruvate dehydrogenase E2 component (dihydrolipoamide acetyltransferase)
MTVEVFIPKFGQTVEQVELVRWLVPDGSKVSQGQEILEVETDKAIFAVEAGGKGWLHIGPFKEGDTVPVLAVVAIIGKEDEMFTQPTAATATETRDKTPEQYTGQAVNHAAMAVTENEAHEVFTSPRARKLAREKNVDVTRVTPTGGEGIRVVEKDIVAYLANAPKATPVAAQMAAVEGVDLRSVTGTGPRGLIVKEDITRVVQSQPAIVNSQTEVLERIPLKGVRGIIAERMSTSVHTTARVTLVTDVDATEFVAARNRIKEKVEKDWGFTPGYNDLLARIVITALQHFPYMNARLSSDAIEILGHVHLGMAVETERGLLVPIIHNADQKSLRQFGAEFRTLAEQARAGRSLPDDLVGGTFTITNLGMYDIDAFTPVINLPEAAILGVGRIAPKPVARGESIVVRQMWTLSLVFDHRLVDGAPAARFLQFIKQMIEEPYLI